MNSLLCFCGQSSISGKHECTDTEQTGGSTKAGCATQRKRRNSRPRIDNYPGKEAFAVILAHTPKRKGDGGDYSKALDQFILEWAEGNIPELPKTGQS